MTPLLDRGQRRAGAAALVAGAFAWAWAGRSLASPDAAAADDAAAPEAPAEPSSDARLAFSRDGHLGAWLVAAFADGARADDEDHLDPRLDAPVEGGGGAVTRWRLAAASGEAVNVSRALDGRVRGVAYAGGVLHVEHGGRHVLLLGADGGDAVVVDGARVFERAEPRRDGDDLVPLDLPAGDHTVVLALRRYPGATSIGFHARLLDASLAPPAGGWWRLPATGAPELREMATRMSSVSLDRGMTADGYRPVLTVRFRDGAPLGVALQVHARLVRAAPAAAGEPALFDVDAGDVPSSGEARGELAVALPRVAGDEVDDRDWTFEVDVAGRALSFPFYPRRAVREAVARMDRAIAASSPAWLDATSRASVEHLRDRLTDFVAGGDADFSAQLDDARELGDLAAALERQRDPYVPGPAGAGSWRKGVMRRAYVSPADGEPSEFAVYVPPDFDPARRYPLIVALHGMNGRPLEMIMWLFGHDDPDRSGPWEDRHPVKDLPPLEAIVVAPDGNFNAMYRDVGEEDVMNVVDWAAATYPVDPARVTITGPSMGGIGAAACALHYPARFAAAEPLCGYHSYFVRGDIGHTTLRPWERFVAEQRSNVFWAENGMYLPMYVVHGTKDLPEENSGVLIDRYQELAYSMKDEHPDLGHNVWQTTYEDLKGADWLLSHRRPMHPRAIRFKTPRTRWADDAWLHVRELASSDAWGDVTARIDPGNVVWVSARGVAALGIDRDAERVDDAAPVTVHAGGRTLTFQAGEPIELHRDGDGWAAGPKVHAGVYKHGHVTGPIRDAYHEPLLFVWGASDPAQARANEEVARAWARVRWGVRVDYPIMSDAEFYARGEPLANDRALFLVGDARSNRLVRELEGGLPVRVDGDAVVVGSRRVAATDGDADRSQLGAAFICPNPRRPDRYVVVVEGVGPLGTWRSLSLPDMLPDYVVYDAGVAPAGGQLALGAGQVRAAGFFGGDWEPPP